MIESIRTSILLRFFALFLVLYGSIQAIGYTPGVKVAYQNHFINMTNKLFDGYGDKGIVKAMANEDKEEKELDVMILLSSEKLYQEAIKSGENVRIARSSIFSKFFGFFPLSILLALVLATPLNWKQKLLSLVLGLILIQLFIVFRMWLHIVFVFHDNEWLEVVNLSAISYKLISFLGSIFIYNVVVVVLVPFLIWILVAVLPFPRSTISTKLNTILLPLNLNEQAVKAS